MGNHHFATNFPMDLPMESHGFQGRRGPLLVLLRQLSASSRHVSADLGGEMWAEAENHRVYMGLPSTNWRIIGFNCLIIGLVNVPIKHHPTIGDISSPTDICFGDVKPIPKKGHQSQPLLNDDK